MIVQKILADNSVTESLDSTTKVNLIDTVGEHTWYLRVGRRRQIMMHGRGTEPGYYVIVVKGKQYQISHLLDDTKPIFNTFITRVK